MESSIKNPIPFTICQPADGATSDRETSKRLQRHGSSAQLLAKSQAHVLEVSGFVARAISLLPFACRFPFQKGTQGVLCLILWGRAGKPSKNRERLPALTR